jgi:hypothetical protein
MREDPRITVKGVALKHVADSLAASGVRLVAASLRLALPTSKGQASHDCL